MPHKDPIKNAAYMREYRRTHKEHWRAYIRSYYQKNKAKWKSTPETLEHRRVAMRELRARRKAELIKQYGGKCTCCGEDRVEFLSIDHIFGGGNKERKTMGSPSHGTGLHQHLKNLGWPKDRYRLLCFNCNLARGFFGYCPHEREKAICA